MNIKQKHYPHPVLESQFNDADPDFKDSFFDVSINYQLNKNRTELLLETIFDLKNDTLRSLINNGKAVFALLIVCESTSTRILKYTNLYEEKFHIRTKSLNKTVIIYPYILANKNIENYSNVDLIEPINNLVFDVKRGDILAIAPNYEIFLEKEALFEAGSIFEFIELKEKNAPLLSFNPNHPKIQIYLPSDTYNKVKEIANYSGPVSHVLISLLYVPAVVFALQSVISLNHDPERDIQLLEYKDFNWYRTLETKLVDLKLGDDLFEINEDKIIDIAYRLMENPIDKSLWALDELILRTEES